jgi:hypothetical protein
MWLLACAAELSLSMSVENLALPGVPEDAVLVGAGPIAALWESNAGKMLREKLKLEAPPEVFSMPVTLLELAAWGCGAQGCSGELSGDFSRLDLDWAEEIAGSRRVQLQLLQPGRLTLGEAPVRFALQPEAGIPVQVQASQKHIKVWDLKEGSGFDPGRLEGLVPEGDVWMAVIDPSSLVPAVIARLELEQTEAAEKAVLQLKKAGESPYIRLISKAQSLAWSIDLEDPRLLLWVRADQQTLSELEVLARLGAIGLRARVTRQEEVLEVEVRP